MRTQACDATVKDGFEFNILFEALTMLWSLSLHHKNQSYELPVSSTSLYSYSHFNIKGMFVLTCHFSRLIICCCLMLSCVDRHVLAKY